MHANIHGEFHPLYSDLINCKMYIWHASLHMHEFWIHPLYPLYMLIVTCKFYFDVYECMLTYAWKQDKIHCNLYNQTYINPQPIQSDSKAIESKLPFQLMLTMWSKLGCVSFVLKVTTIQKTRIRGKGWPSHSLALSVDHIDKLCRNAYI